MRDPEAQDTRRFMVAVGRQLRKVWMTAVCSSAAAQTNRLNAGSRPVAARRALEKRTVARYKRYEPLSGKRRI